jgi:hypothetical protein
LVASHDDGIEDIIYGSAAREVVYGRCEALKDRTYGTGTCEALHQFVCDIAYLK